MNWLSFQANGQGYACPASVILRIEEPRLLTPLPWADTWSGGRVDGLTAAANGSPLLQINLDGTALAPNRWQDGKRVVLETPAGDLALRVERILGALDAPRDEIKIDPHALVPWATGLLIRDHPPVPEVSLPPADLPLLRVASGSHTWALRIDGIEGLARVEEILTRCAQSGQTALFARIASGYLSALPLGDGPGRVAILCRNQGRPHALLAERLLDLCQISPQQLIWRPDGSCWWGEETPVEVLSIRHWLGEAQSPQDHKPAFDGFPTESAYQVPAPPSEYQVRLGAGPWDWLVPVTEVLGEIDIRPLLETLQSRGSHDSIPVLDLRRLPGADSASMPSSTPSSMPRAVLVWAGQQYLVWLLDRIRLEHRDDPEYPPPDTLPGPVLAAIQSLGRDARGHWAFRPRQTLSWTLRRQLVGLRVGHVTSTALADFFHDPDEPRNSPCRPLP
ncbi:hypothetical protein CCP4SC76_1450019 [Gammaproteobacteria bacterium]